MKTIVNVMFACCTAVMATACALLAPLDFDKDARRAAQITLQSYATLQQAVLIYGQLPDCTDPPVYHLCKQRQHWRRVRAAEKAATEAIAAATQVLNAEEAGATQLLQALAAIDALSSALSNARAQWKEEGS